MMPCDGEHNTSGIGCPGTAHLLRETAPCTGMSALGGDGFGKSACIWAWKSLMESCSVHGPSHVPGSPYLVSVPEALLSSGVERRLEVRTVHAPGLSRLAPRTRHLSDCGALLTRPSCTNCYFSTQQRTHQPREGAARGPQLGKKGSPEALTGACVQGRGKEDSPHLPRRQLLPYPVMA